MKETVNIDDLAKAILKLRTEDEVRLFMRDLLTNSELETLALRWKVAKMLDQGLPYTQIERETGASSATIAKVSEYLKYGNDGFRLVLDRINRK